MAFTAVHGGRLHEGVYQIYRLDAHVYACVCICILRWEVAPIHAGGCSILLGNLRSTRAPLIGIHTGAHRHPHRGQQAHTLKPIGIHTGPIGIIYISHIMSYFSDFVGEKMCEFQNQKSYISKSKVLNFLVRIQGKYTL